MRPHLGSEFVKRVNPVGFAAQGSRAAFRSDGAAARWGRGMTPIEQGLADIRASSTDEQDKGRRFELLMLHAFQTDRTFRQQFSQVWTWLDWPDRHSADIGVDLVARNVDGTLTAIQCKCYAPTATLTKEEIDSFVALSGQKQWSRRIIVATTDLWSSNAEKSLEGHAIPIDRIGIDDLDAMTVDWLSYDVTNPSGVAPSPGTSSGNTRSRPLTRCGTALSMPTAAS